MRPWEGVDGGNGGTCVDARPLKPTIYYKALRPRHVPLLRVARHTATARRLPALVSATTVDGRTSIATLHQAVIMSHDLYFLARRAQRRHAPSGRHLSIILDLQL